MTKKERNFIMKKFKKVVAVGLATMAAVSAMSMTAMAEGNNVAVSDSTTQPTYTIDASAETWVPVYENSDTAMPLATISESFNETIPDGGTYKRILTADPQGDNRVRVSIDAISQGGTVTVRLVNLDDGGSAYASLRAGQNAVFNVTGEFSVYMSADYRGTVQGAISTFFQS